MSVIQPEDEAVGTFTKIAAVSSVGVGRKITGRSGPAAYASGLVKIAVPKHCATIHPR